MDFNDLKPAQMEIKVLGTGCAKCNTLEKLTQQAVEELGLQANIIKVDDIVEIMKYKVMATPALVVNDTVVLKGKVPKLDKLKALLQK